MAQTEQEQIEDDLAGRLQSADQPHVSVSRLHCTTGLSPTCQFSAVVTRWSRSTQLLYIEPG